MMRQMLEQHARDAKAQGLDAESGLRAWFGRWIGGTSEAVGRMESVWWLAAYKAA